MSMLENMQNVSINRRSLVAGAAGLGLPVFSLAAPTRVTALGPVPLPVPPRAAPS